MNLSNFTVSFLADDIIRLRYVAIDGQLRKMLLVVKMRRSQHSIDMVEYEITSKGVVIGEPLRGYRAPDQRHPRSLGLPVGGRSPAALRFGRRRPQWMNHRHRRRRRRRRTARTRSSCAR